MDFRPVDKRAIGRAQVPDDHGIVVHQNVAVGAGDAGVIEAEIIAGAAAEKIDSKLEMDVPSLRSPGIDHKSWHLCWMSAAA